MDTAAIPDGVTYVRVEISDDLPGAIRFTVSVLPALTSVAGSNFGIDSFAFNLLTPGTPALVDSATSP